MAQVSLAGLSLLSPSLSSAAEPAAGEKLLQIKLGGVQEYHSAVLVKDPAGIRIKSLPEMLHEYQPGGRITTADLLIRIAQDLGDAGLGSQLDLRQGDAVKRRVWRLAEELLAELQHSCALRRAAGEPFGLTEHVDCFNRIFFEDRKFQYRPLMLAGDPRRIRSRTLGEVLETRQGVCEELTGLAISVLDILRAAGLELEAAPVIVPGHVFLVFHDRHGEVYVELTARGEKRTAAECRTLLGLPEEIPSGYMRPQLRGGAAGALNNWGIILLLQEDRDKRQRGLRYLEEASRLCPDVPMLYENLARAHQTVAFKLDSADAKPHAGRSLWAIRKAGLLNPWSPELRQTRRELEQFFLRFEED